MLDMNMNNYDFNNNETIKKENYQYVKSLSSNIKLAGIIKIPKKEEKKSYSELPFTEENKSNIDDLITSFGTKGKLSIIFEEKRLRGLIHELRDLHPYKFLTYIFSNPALKNYMTLIFEDSFKRSNFIKEFSQTMDIYDFKNLLSIYLQDFANDVNASYDELVPLIKDKKWEEFVKFLICN